SVVRLLIAKEGIDINSKGNDGQTPLWAAASGGHESVVRLLIAKEGIDINSKDNKRTTPLWAASRFGHEAVVRLTDDIAINPVPANDIVTNPAPADSLVPSPVADEKVTPENEHEKIPVFAAPDILTDVALEVQNLFSAEDIVEDRVPADHVGSNLVPTDDVAPNSVKADGVVPGAVPAGGVTPGRDYIIPKKAEDIVPNQVPADHVMQNQEPADSIVPSPVAEEMHYRENDQIIRVPIPTDLASEVENPFPVEEIEQQDPVPADHIVPSLVLLEHVADCAMPSLVPAGEVTPGREHIIPETTQDIMPHPVPTNHIVPNQVSAEHVQNPKPMDSVVPSSVAEEKVTPENGHVIRGSRPINESISNSTAPDIPTDVALEDHIVPGPIPKEGVIPGRDHIILETTEDTVRNPASTDQTAPNLVSADHIVPNAAPAESVARNPDPAPEETATPENNHTTRGPTPINESISICNAPNIDIPTAMGFDVIINVASDVPNPFPVEDILQDPVPTDQAVPKPVPTDNVVPNPVSEGDGAPNLVLTDKIRRNLVPEGDGAPNSVPKVHVVPNLVPNARIKPSQVSALGVNRGRDHVIPETTRDPLTRASSSVNPRTDVPPFEFYSVKIPKPIDSTGQQDRLEYIHWTWTLYNKEFLNDLQSLCDRLAVRMYRQQKFLIHGNADYEKPGMLAFAFYIFSSRHPDYDTALASWNDRSRAIPLNPDMEKSLRRWAEGLKDKNRPKDIPPSSIKQPPSENMIINQILKQRVGRTKDPVPTAPSPGANQEASLYVAVGLKRSQQDNLKIRFSLGEDDEDTKLIEEIRRIIIKEHRWFKRWFSFKKLKQVSIKSYKLHDGDDCEKTKNFVYIVDPERNEVEYLKDWFGYCQDLANRRLWTSRTLKKKEMHPNSCYEDHTS
ncbi:tyrosine/serine/threonine protein phosphatase, partial [Rhizina undulata]